MRAAPDCGPEESSRAQTRSVADSRCRMKPGAIVVLLNEGGEVRQQMVQIVIRGRVEFLPLQSS